MDTIRNTALNHVRVSWKSLALSGACGRKELCRKSTRTKAALPIGPILFSRPYGAGGNSDGKKKLVWILWQDAVRESQSKLLGFWSKSMTSAVECYTVSEK